MPCVRGISTARNSVALRGETRRADDAAMDVDQSDSARECAAETATESREARRDGRERRSLRQLREVLRDEPLQPLMAQWRARGGGSGR